jgi:MerR family transcriptional regulator, light-induced transcriptional regulator
MESNIFSIKELENLSGVKAHTIRIWEYRYDFLKPARTDTNIRYYRSQELKTVLDISLLNKYGYRMSQLNRMSPEELRSKILALSDKQAERDRLVNDLIARMIDFDSETFEQVLDAYILTHGIDKAITRIVFPFLDRIGILWFTGHVNAAQEHLVSHVIRQKLIVGIDRGSAVHPVNKTGLLFLPEGEHHELGLLYVYYLLKTHGVGVLYLGADLPLKDLESVCAHRKPDFLYSHLTGIAGNFNVEKFFTRIQQRIGIPLVVSGSLARAQLRKLPAAGVDLRQSIAEVMAFIASL